MPPLRDPVERFWEKVDRTGDCWLWTAATNHYGYGVFKVGGNKNVFAHRFAYELLVGPINKPKLDHRYTCPKNCVNPAHLRPATHKEDVENHDGPPGNNTSGIRGVYWNKWIGKWHAYVQHNGKNLHAGWFDAPPPPAKAPLEAEAVVIAKRLELHTRNDWDRDHGGVR